MSAENTYRIRTHRLAIFHLLLAAAGLWHFRPVGNALRGVLRHRLSTCPCPFRTCERIFEIHFRGLCWHRAVEMHGRGTPRMAFPTFMPFRRLSWHGGVEMHGRGTPRRAFPTFMPFRRLSWHGGVEMHGRGTPRRAFPTFMPFRRLSWHGGVEMHGRGTPRRAFPTFVPFRILGWQNGIRNVRAPTAVLGILNLRSQIPNPPSFASTRLSSVK